MPETLTEKLDTLKDLFQQIQEGVYSGRPILSKHDRLLAYDEFETRAGILRSKYTQLPEKESQPLLAQLKDLETEFREFGISYAEQKQARERAAYGLNPQSEQSQPKCKEESPIQRTLLILRYLHSNSTPIPEIVNKNGCWTIKFPEYYTLAKEWEKTLKSR